MELLTGLQRSRSAFAGWVMADVFSRLIALIVGGTAMNTGTVVVDSANDSTLHTITIVVGGFTRVITYTSGTGATLASIATGIKNAINSDPILGMYVIATSSSDTVTITAIRADVTFTVTDSDANLSSTSDVTASDTGDTIEFGCGVARSSTEGECLRADTGSFSFEVWAFTPTHVNDKYYSCGLELLNGPYQGKKIESIYLSDGSAAVQEIVEYHQAELDAALALTGNDWTVTEDNAILTLTSTIRGQEAAPIHSARWAASRTTRGGIFNFVGVACHRHKEPNSSGVARWEGGEQAIIITEGRVRVVFEGSAPASLDSPVYMRVTASGTEKYGAFSATLDSTDQVCLPRQRARWASLDIATDPNGVRTALLDLYPVAGSLAA